jgi:branched-chain amino acid aminotransferase
VTNYQMWLRGKIIESKDAKVSVLSPMAQFGLNVFEGIRCYWNSQESRLYAFRLDDHIDRLFDSCRIVSLRPPHTRSEIISAISDTIRANDFKCDIAIRLTFFVDGEGSWTVSDPVSMFVHAAPRDRTTVRTALKLKAGVSSWVRISENAFPPRAKVGANYINSRYAMLQAKNDGYDVPIFLTQSGKVAEGSGACIFMLRHGSLITPTTTSSILESITRRTVLTIAQEMGVSVLEREIDRTELYTAEELFLCGSAAEISPIVQIDKFVVGKGNSGALTSELMSRYLQLVSGETAAHSEWRTAVG